MIPDLPAWLELSYTTLAPTPVTVVPLIETTTVGSLIPAVDLITDQNKFNSYLEILNQKFDLGLNYKNFIKEM